MEKGEGAGGTAFVVIDGAQAGEGVGIGRIKLEDIEVFDFGFGVLPGVVEFVSAGEVASSLDFGGATGGEEKRCGEAYEGEERAKPTDSADEPLTMPHPAAHGRNPFRVVEI